MSDLGEAHQHCNSNFFFLYIWFTIETINTAIDLKLLKI